MPDLIVWKNQRINRLRRDMDQMFDRICCELGTAFTPRITDRVPTVDLTEDENNLVLRAEIPGADPKDLDIDIVDDMLTIRGETKQEKVIEGENYHRTERSYGFFNRTIQLPCRIMMDDVMATYKKGILKIVMPKCKPEATRKVHIKLR